GSGGRHQSGFGKVTLRSTVKGVALYRRTTAAGRAAKPDRHGGAAGRCAAEGVLDPVRRTDRRRELIGIQYAGITCGVRGCGRGRRPVGAGPGGVGEVSRSDQVGTVGRRVSTGLQDSRIIDRVDSEYRRGAGVLYLEGSGGVGVRPEDRGALRQNGSCNSVNAKVRVAARVFHLESRCTRADDDLAVAAVYTVRHTASAQQAAVARAATP